MSHAINSFHNDVRRGDLAAVKRALGRQPALLQGRSGADQRTALHIAADVGNQLVLRTLLHAGADYAAADAAGEVPLMLASRQGHQAVVRELLADAGRRSCLKAMAKDGGTALHAAAAAGRAGVVQLLLGAGARADVRDRAGRAPADMTPPEAAAVVKILAHGRHVAGAPRSPTAAAAAADHAGVPPLSPCKSPTGIRSVRASVAGSPARAASNGASPARPAGPGALADAPAAVVARTDSGCSGGPMPPPLVPLNESVVLRASQMHEGPQAAGLGDGHEGAGRPAEVAASAAARRSLIGSQGPLHQHQSVRAEEEHARWQKVNGTVVGLMRLLEEQDARVLQLEAANAAATEHLAQQEADIERTQQEQQAAVAALSDSVRQLLSQGRALLRAGAAPSAGDAGMRPRPASAPAGDEAAPGGAQACAGLDPSVEEFMEATSGCLQLHERRLDDLQEAVPAIQAAVRDKAQLSELARQVAALETTLAVLTGARAGTPGGPPLPAPRPVPVLKCGPLSAVPHLQQQIAALGTEFDRLRAAMAAEVGRVRADAEADRADRVDERTRAAAASEVAARREAELRREMAEREERLLQIREAALSEESARRELLELERALEARVAQLADAQAATARELRAVQDCVRQLEESATEQAADAAAAAALLAAQQAAPAPPAAAPLEAAASAASAEGPPPAELAAAALGSEPSAAAAAPEEDDREAEEREEGEGEEDAPGAREVSLNPFLAAGRPEAVACGGDDDGLHDVAARGPGGVDVSPRRGASPAIAPASPEAGKPQRPAAAAAAAAAAGDNDAEGESDKPRRRGAVKGAGGDRPGAEGGALAAEKCERGAAAAQPGCAACPIM